MRESAPRIEHRPGRKTTWFELFFDLTFVIAVAGLVSAMATDHTQQGTIRFVFLFLVLWWLWLGQAFLFSRFDRDLPVQRALGLLQMAAVLAVAHGAADPLGAGLWFIAAGVALFKAVLAVGYLRERARPGLAPLCDRYAAIYGVQALLWLASPVVDAVLLPLLWGSAVLLDLLSPFLLLRETPLAPPHPEHLPERFGLFTLIVMGESAVAAFHVLEHGTGDLGLAALGLGLGFLFWLGYFGPAKGGHQRGVSDGRFRLWAWGHLPLLLGLAAAGAGLRVLAEDASPWLFSCGAAAAMAGITIITAARAMRPLQRAAPHVALAMLCLLPPVLWDNPTWVTGATVLIAAAQIGLGQAWRGIGHV
jgi:low temperature requirement protein LtrA